MNDFSELNLPPLLNQALAKMNFTAPTPIQAQTIPLALQGRDILGSAQTGTGKTGAFGISVVAQLLANPNAMAVILAPTRELAVQVNTALRPMTAAANIKTAVLIGGEPMRKQFDQLDRRPRLVIGTPGRMNDHLDRGSLVIDTASFLVLDEMDRMLDMGFGVQIERIISHMPEDRQTLMFSATMPPKIVKAAAQYLRDAARISVGSVHAPMAKIEQETLRVNEGEKYQVLLDQLDTRDGTVVIFVKTKYGTERLAGRLRDQGHTADAIHGDLQQRRRDRVIQEFRAQKYRILVATDVAARGLDIPHIAHVINYDLPQCPEDYIHRIGRTARAGAEGRAVNMVTPADSDKWRAIERLIAGKEPGNDDGPRRGGAGRRRGGGGKPFGSRSFGGGRGEGENRGGGRSFGPRGFGGGRSEGENNRGDGRGGRSFGGNSRGSGGGGQRRSEEGGSGSKPFSSWRDRRDAQRHENKGARRSR